MTDNYAQQWAESSKFFYNKGYYSWMCEKIKNYKTVLEIGCGAGYGTLSLAKGGHNIISVEKDRDCLCLSKKLVDDSGLSSQVVFINDDIITGKQISETFDIVICWNPGIGKTEGLHDYVPHMLDYGLTLGQIRVDFISSYSEYLVWQISRIAKESGVPYHLIDRCSAIGDPQIEKYYHDIKDEIGFSRIEIDYLKGESLSTAGVPLQIKGKQIKEPITTNILVSVIMS